LKKEEDEKVEDIRREYLKSLVYEIFFTTANSCEKRKDETTSTIVTCVVRGEGKPMKDCSFLATDFKRYVKLFEATFTDKKCLFDYKGKNSKQKDFSRDIAISNAVDFFKLNNISLYYVFYSQAEKYLFSRLLYRYIKQLLNVLFDEYTSEDIKILNSLVREKYNKVLDKIRVEVDTVDIYELIYRNAHWSDAEFVTYNGLDIKECDSIIMIENAFDYEKARLVDDIDRCMYMRPSDRRSTYTYNEISYKSYELNMMSRLSIKCYNQQQYIPVEIIQLSDKKNTIRLDKEKYIPRFVCIAFRKKDIEDELIADSKNDIDNLIIINNLDDLEKELYNRLEAYVQTEYISKNYTAQRKQIMTPMEQSVRLIQELLQVDYGEFFNEDDHIPDVFQVVFDKFVRILKTHKIKINKEKIIYKYLFSLWIDSFCGNLLARIDPVNKEYSIIEDYSKRLKEFNKLQLIKEMKSKKKNNKPDSLENANTLFISFYQKHKATITAFNEKVDILKYETFDSEFEYRLEKGESPYSALRHTLCEFKKSLEEMAE